MVDYLGEALTMDQHLKILLEKYPELDVCANDIMQAFLIMKECYLNSGKALFCGNGGSAADSDHIVGELMKGFHLPRPLRPEIKRKFTERFGDEGAAIADQLQAALPAISLVSHGALITAFMNDVNPELIFAQQVLGYGKPGDVLVALSTSGNSKNVVCAVKTAKVLGLKCIGLAGWNGGALNDLCDVTIKVPSQSTPDIQERHLPIYHAICLMLEDFFFGQH
jgi:D-sedoheptulose 7-phosphate isomerase